MFRHLSRTDILPRRQPARKTQVARLEIPIQYWQFSYNQKLHVICVRSEQKLQKKSTLLFQGREDFSNENLKFPVLPATNFNSFLTDVRILPIFVMIPKEIIMMHVPSVTPIICYLIYKNYFLWSSLVVTAKKEQNYQFTFCTLLLDRWDRIRSDPGSIDTILIHNQLQTVWPLPVSS